MTVAVTDLDGINILTPAGEIDFATRDVLRQALDTAKATGPHIAVDLHHVTFIDSTGINVLIAAHHELTAADGWLRLADVPPAIQRTLEIVGVDTVIGCYPTVTDALA
ncbi:anti-anti-sigma factor [Streptomyces sp. GKU 895]|nr:anti-anti-sigma factor [Streptomyces sp. GKU 895]